MHILEMFRNGNFAVYCETEEEYEKIYSFFMPNVDVYVKPEKVCVFMEKGQIRCCLKKHYLRITKIISFDEFMRLYNNEIKEMENKLEKEKNSLIKLYELALKDRDKNFLLEYGQDIENSYYTLDCFIKRK